MNAEPSLECKGLVERQAIRVPGKAGSGWGAGFGFPGVQDATHTGMTDGSDRAHRTAKVPMNAGRFGLPRQGKQKDPARRPDRADEGDWFAILLRQTHVPVGVSRLSDGRYRMANDAFLRLFGYTRDEVIGKTASDLGLWPDLEERTRLLSLLSEAEAVSGFEAKFRDKAGRVGDLAISAERVVLEGEQHLVGFLTDISERKRAERELRESQRRLEFALTGSGLGLWDYHVAEETVVYDDRWCAMLGYRVDEINPELGSWQKLVHPDDWSGVQQAVEAHMSGESATYETEHRVRHKDGHWVWVLARGRIVQRSPEGVPLRVAGTVLDITEQRRLSREVGLLLRRVESLIRGVASPPRENATRETGSGGERADRLTRRQGQILQLVTAGLTSRQIAARLKIAESTVASHRRDLMRRLKLHNVADLTRHALQYRLPDPD